MPSGKRARQQRRAAATAKTPPPVRSKGAGPRARQASPRALALGGVVVVLAAVGIGLAFALGGGGTGLPAGTPTVGAVDAYSLPGAAEIRDLYKGIPQDGLYLGSPKAPVQMVMFIDLQCPVCQNFEVTALPTIVKKYVRTGKVRLHLRPWAFLGVDSFTARSALIAASFQNLAFQFAGVLYDNQGTENSGWVTNSSLASIAASVPGLDVAKVFQDRNSSQAKSVASEVDKEARADNVTGTPTIFVGRKGAKPKNVAGAGLAPTLKEVEDAIDAALARS